MIVVIKGTVDFIWTSQAGGCGRSKKVARREFQTQGLAGVTEATLRVK
jgi:hypothetical protein